MKWLMIVFLCAMMGNLYSQNNIFDQKGIGVQFGAGNNNLIDEYISQNEYTGISYTYGISWLDRNDSRETGIVFNYGKINNLKNINNRAAVYQFDISYRYLYTIYNGTLFSKPLNIYLGPGFGISMHYREQEMVSTIKALSAAALIYANAAVSAVSAISDNLSIAGNVSLSLLTFTGRIPSMKDADQVPTPVTLLSIPSLINFSTSIIAQYNISKSISARLGYGFKFLKINDGNRFKLLSDNIILECGVAF